MLDQPFEEQEVEQEQEMTFLDHLEELRWHIVRSLVAVVILTILAFIFKDIVVAVVLGPSNTSFWTYQALCRLSEALNLADALCIEKLNFSLINRKIMGQFTQHISVAFFTGIILAFPYMLWEVWRFLKPALRRSERSYLRGIVFSGSVLFFMGICCGYYMLAPISVQFLANYTFIDSLENTIDLASYISLVTMVTLATALVFELPIIVFFLSKMGLVTPEAMRAYRKHALIIILVLSAVITPPDLMSQILLTVPFFALYEASILISRSVQRKEKKKLK